MSGYERFAPVYDTWAANMVEDIDFYVDLAAHADGPVLELAVGTGRIAVPIVQRTGRRVIGIDLSPSMLALAREHAAEAGVELELHEGDMRELDLRAGDRSRHLPVPRAPPPADLGRSPPRLRARRPRASSRRPVRLERLRVRPPLRRRVRRTLARRATAPSHGVRGRRQSRRHHDRGRSRFSRCGGSHAPSGKGSSTSPASRSRRSTAGSIGDRSTTRAASSSWVARKPG